MNLMQQLPDKKETTYEVSSKSPELNQPKALKNESDQSQPFHLSPENNSASPNMEQRPQNEEVSDSESEN